MAPFVPGKDGWARLRKADRRALECLEELAGEVNAMEALDQPPHSRRNRELMVFSARVYETLHWVSAPDCRKNHPGFDPSRPQRPVKFPRRPGAAL
jgi:hypothetical protein